MVECNSRTLKTSEFLYSIYELEMLAYIYGVTSCRQYLDGVHFTCITDHEALIWFDSIRHLLSKHRLRWYLTAQCFDCTFIHRPGSLHSDADAVSRVFSHQTPSKDIVLPIEENPFKFIPNQLNILNTPTNGSKFNDMMARQLSLLDISNKSLDPWEDDGLMNFIKTGKHFSGISKKQVGRIEHLAKRYIFQTIICGINIRKILKMK